MRVCVCARALGVYVGEEECGWFIAENDRSIIKTISATIINNRV